MFVIAKHHDVLRWLGLDSLDGVKRFRGELIKDHKGRRDIQRVVTSAGGQPLVLYLKRNWQAYKKDGLRSLLTRGRVWSLSRVEWENSLALQRAGICVAEPVAYGEESGPLWEKFSFILTAAATGDTTLEDFLRTNASAGERRRILESCARLIARMHDAGLASPDLFTRHIFLQRGGKPRFCLIDMARLNHRRSIPAAMRARDLAALNITAPLRFVSTRERLRFLKSYGGNRGLRRRIVLRTKYLMRRRKFAEFSQ